MFTKKQISDIIEHLSLAQNPVFFFDNDLDGLCSFLLLQRFIGRGRGVAIKSFPELDASYFRKVEELNVDYIFILDKPIVSKEFFEKTREKNIPIVWIDHHMVDNFVPEFISYYNPVFNNPKSDEPVTALCYQVTKKRDDMWIAVVGCIADNYMPDFYRDFSKEYPELSIKTKNPFEVLYKSRIREIANIMSAGLKDTTTNVVTMLKFLMKIKTPYELLEESNKTHLFHKRTQEIYEKYRKLFSKAKDVAVKSGKVVFFTYSGDLGISSELANELKFNFPKKIIVVARINGLKINVSLRGEKIKDIFLEAIEGIESARGGGHEDAVGGQMSVDDFNKFRENLEKLVG